MIVGFVMSGDNLPVYQWSESNGDLPVKEDLAPGSGEISGVNDRLFRNIEKAFPAGIADNLNRS